MKVIGKTDGGFVVVVEADEMAQIRGGSSEYGLTRDGKETKVGSTYNIASLYQEAHITLEAYAGIQASIKGVLSTSGKLLAQIEASKKDK